MAHNAKHFSQDELARLEDGEYRDYMRTQLTQARSRKRPRSNAGHVVVSAILTLLMGGVLLHNAGVISFP